MESASKRFGERSNTQIDTDIINNVPKNTLKSRKSIWGQFNKFMSEKQYKLDEFTSPLEINDILKSWAANMKKMDGTDYKEGVVKQMWNCTAKIVQEMYFNTWNIKINPFSDAVFQSSRQARDATRKKLQILPGKRTNSAGALTETEYLKIVSGFDENTPVGLQKIFFFIVSYELAWRGGEGVHCMTYFFKEDIDNNGSLTNRIEYNPVFSKTAQGGAKKLAESKWLIVNENVDFCPIR